MLSHRKNFELVESPSVDAVSELTRRLFLYNQSQFPNLRPESDDKVFMVNALDRSEHVVGSILANCYWDGLEIDTLWIADSERGKGLGAELVEQAELFGIKHGAVIAFLKTMDAKLFYEKLGYEVYGVLEDRPIGTLLYHMKKRLQAKM